MCQWNFEMVILFLSIITSRVDLHSMCSVPSTINIFSKKAHLPFINTMPFESPPLDVALVVTLSSFLYIICNLFAKYISVCTTFSWHKHIFIIPHLFIWFNCLLIILDLASLQIMVASAVPTWFCVSWHEPVIWSLKIMLGGHYMLVNLFDTNHISSNCFKDTNIYIKLSDMLLIQQ